MRRAILAVAAAGMVLGIVYLLASWQYPMGTARKPGPGLYPVMVGCLLIVASGVTGWGVISKAPPGQVDWPRGVGRWRIAAILAAILAYILMLSEIGHPTAAAAATLISLQALGGVRWPLKIGLAVAFGLGSYYLFNQLLGVPLPSGIWFR